MLQVELAELIEDRGELGAVVLLLGLLDLQVQELLDARMVLLRAAELERLLQGLVERGIELEGAIVEAERLVDVVHLAGRHDRGGLHVLGALLLVLDEVRHPRPLDDLDELLAQSFSSE